jgi:probable rRNA maturation factor
MSGAVSWLVRPPLLSKEQVETLVRSALETGGRAGASIDVVFGDDALLSELHGRWLDDPSPTDVLSFDLGEGPGPAGEVLVSVERAQEVAAQRKVEPSAELALYLVHGVLHLCGFDDCDREHRRAMRAAEREALRNAGHIPPDFDDDLAV